jgi:DNA repair exonuclease SbcCD ATPase subunit
LQEQLFASASLLREESGAPDGRETSARDCDRWGTESESSGPAIVARLQEQLSASASLLRGRSEACSLLEAQLQRVREELEAARDEALGAAVWVAEMEETLQEREREIEQLTEQVHSL